LLQDYVSVGVTENLWNRTAGLCGLLDGRVDNDFTSKDGSSSHSLSSFISSWKVKPLGGGHISVVHFFFFSSSLFLSFFSFSLSSSYYPHSSSSARSPPVLLDHQRDILQFAAVVFFLLTAFPVDS
jgi:hypothetical protein